jgi:hypothetical protein
MKRVETYIMLLIFKVNDITPRIVCFLSVLAPISSPSLKVRNKPSINVILLLCEIEIMRQDSGYSTPQPTTHTYAVPALSLVPSSFSSGRRLDRHDAAFSYEFCVIGVKRPLVRTPVLGSRQLKIVGHFRENHVLSRLDVR